MKISSGQQEKTFVTHFDSSFGVAVAVVVVRRGAKINLHKTLVVLSQLKSRDMQTILPSLSDSDSTLVKSIMMTFFGSLLNCF